VCYHLAAEVVAISYTAGVILACLGILVIIGMVNEAWARFRGRSIISRKQFALRLTIGFLLLIAIGLIFVAAIYRFSNPWLALGCLAAPFVLVTSALLLAWFDRRQLAHLKAARRAELYADLVRLQQELLSRKGEKPKP
jgi:uncharacterized BrkB/YihY/UPF0761 family membrane protein